MHHFLFSSRIFAATDDKRGLKNLIDPLKSGFPGLPEERELTDAVSGG